MKGDFIKHIPFGNWYVDVRIEYRTPTGDPLDVDLIEVYLTTLGYSHGNADIDKINEIDVWDVLPEKVQEDIDRDVIDYIRTAVIGGRVNG